MRWMAGASVGVVGFFMGFVYAQRDCSDEDDDTAECDPSRGAYDGVAVGEFDDVFAGFKCDCGPEVVGANEGFGFAVDGGVPVGVVVLRDDEDAGSKGCCSEFEIALVFVVFEAFNTARFAGVGGDAGVFFDYHGLRGVGVGVGQFLEDLIFIGYDFVLGREVKPG